MTSFQITELKSFMGKLLGTDCFDSFLLAGAQVVTAVEYTIDGRIHPEFYTKEELQDPHVCPCEFVSWAQMRPILFQMIRGKRSPSRFKLMLHLNPEYVPAVMKGADPSLLPEQVKALVLTVRYEDGRAFLVTGTAFHSFVLDKTLDACWDKTIRRFLTSRQIAYTEPSDTCFNFSSSD